jgi:hypothetical protein
LDKKYKKYPIILDASHIQAFSLSELQVECPGVSLPTIKRVLGEMKKEGLVMLTGRGRGAKWSRLG